MNRATITLALAVMTTCVLALHNMSYEDEKLAAERYCASVEKWRADQVAGVEPLNRRGHPDYDSVAEHCSIDRYDTPSDTEIAAVTE